MEYIDLHMHSCFSDGTDTPDELVRKASEAGVGLIALTDHNTLGGIEEFRQACSRYGQAGIPGVELSTGWEEKRPAPPFVTDSGVSSGRTSVTNPAAFPAKTSVIDSKASSVSTSVTDPGTLSDKNTEKKKETEGLFPSPDFPDVEPPEIHVLGYFPPESDFSAPAFAPLRKVIEDYHLLKIRHNEAMVRRIAAAGIGGKISVEGFHAFARSLSDSGNYNRVHIARYLVAAGAAATIDQAFQKYIGKECPYYVPRRSISVPEAIEAIHAGGGTAVVAHVGEYHFDPEQLDTFFRNCQAWGIDGFELLHPHNTPETAEQILRFADRFLRETGRVLLLTAGSDYHGGNKLNCQAFPWAPPYAWE